MRFIRLGKDRKQELAPTGRHDNQEQVSCPIKLAALAAGGYAVLYFPSDQESYNGKAKSQSIWIASQWGSSMMDRQKSTPVSST